MLEIYKPKIDTEDTKYTVKKEDTTAASQDEFTPALSRTSALPTTKQIVDITGNEMFIPKENTSGKGR